MITIHTVQKKIQERIKTHEKKHISLISFLTIFNNIKGRKNKKDKNIGLI